MRYTYKFRETQNELKKQGLKMLVYTEGKKNVFFVAKNEQILSKHMLVASVIKKYGLDESICVSVSEN